MARIFGTILIVLSGTMIFSDKLFKMLELEGGYTFGYENFSNFIWAFTQSFAPFLLIIGFYLKPYRSAFLVPIYCYSLQLIWVFGVSYSDQHMQYVYSLGICGLYLLIIYILKLIIQTGNRKKRESEEFVTEAKDVLEILKHKVLHPENS